MTSDAAARPVPGAPDGAPFDSMISIMEPSDAFTKCVRLLVER